MQSFILDHQQINTSTSTICLEASENMLFKDGGFNTFIEDSGESPGSHSLLHTELVVTVWENMIMLPTISFTSLIEIVYAMINKKYKAHIILKQPLNLLNIS